MIKNINNFDVEISSNGGKFSRSAYSRVCRLIAKSGINFVICGQNLLAHPFTAGDFTFYLSLSIGQGWNGCFIVNNNIINVDDVKTYKEKLAA